MKQEKHTDEERVRRRYPSVWAKAEAAFRAKHPDASRPVTAAEIEADTGFVTRETVIAEILRAAPFSREIAPGRFVMADAPEEAPAEVRQAARSIVSTDGPEEELVKRALERETRRNRVGVSVAYLRHLCGNPDPASLGALLDTAPWAAKQFGFYRYIEEQTAPAEEDAQIPLDPTLIPRMAEPEPIPAPEPETIPQRTAERFEQLSFAIPEKAREETRVGTVQRAKENKRAKTTALTVDFGRDIGVIKARVPANGLPGGESLAGRQVVCRMTFDNDGCAIRILGVESEGGTVPLVPSEQVKNGDRVNG